MGNNCIPSPLLAFTYRKGSFPSSYPWRVTDTRRGNSFLACSKWTFIRPNKEKQGFFPNHMGYIQNPFYSVICFYFSMCSIYHQTMTTLGKYNIIVVKHQITFEVHVPKHIHTHSYTFPLFLELFHHWEEGSEGFPRTQFTIWRDAILFRWVSIN